MVQGLIQIYTGNGKGKSTAAFGLALRASGWNMRTAIIQFMKDGDGYGETKAIDALPHIDMYSYGIKGFLRKGETPDPLNLQKAQQALAKVRQVLADPEIDIVILDEINNAVYFGLVSEAEVLQLMADKRCDQELILTGRSATAAMIENADLVTEMREIKHPYQKGISARQGIEY